VLARQEQADEVLPQRRALLVAREQVVEGGAELVNRLGGRGGRLRLVAMAHLRSSSGQVSLGDPADRLTSAKRRTRRAST